MAPESCTVRAVWQSACSQLPASSEVKHLQRSSTGEKPFPLPAAGTLECLPAVPLKI